MAREEQQPMSDARLQEIRGSYLTPVETRRDTLSEPHHWVVDIHELLAEVESLRAALESALQLASRQDDELQRLRAREAAWVAYIERMATFSPAARIEDIQRKIIEARALLASADEAK